MEQKPSPLGRAVRRAATLAADPARALSLVEQALISGANFAALLMLARGFDEAAFGAFSYAYLALQFVVNLHRSAVVIPFVVHAATPEALAAEATAWRILNRLAAASAAVLLAGTALPLLPFPEAGWLAGALLTAAVMVPPTVHYEFRRRWLIQLDRYHPTVAAAALYAALLLGGIGLALATHRMTVAVLAFAAAAGCAALLCQGLSPAVPTPCTPQPFGRFLGRLRPFIGWSVLSNLAFNGYGHMPPLILGLLAGPVPVAVFQAIRNLAQPLALVLTAVDNFDKPRAARALALEGRPGLARALANTTLAMGLVCLPYLAALGLAGDRMTALIYGGRYGDTGPVLWWFIAAQAAMIAVYPFETALFVVRRPDLLFRGRLAAAAAGIGLSFALVPAFGIIGAMAAMTAGFAASGAAAALQLPQVSR